MGLSQGSMNASSLHDLLGKHRGQAGHADLGAPASAGWSRDGGPKGTAEFQSNTSTDYSQNVGNLCGDLYSNLNHNIGTLIVMSSGKNPGLR